MEKQEGTLSPLTVTAAPGHQVRSCSSGWQASWKRSLLRHPTETGPTTTLLQEPVTSGKVLTSLGLSLPIFNMEPIKMVGRGPHYLNSRKAAGPYGLQSHQAMMLTEMDF